MSNNIFEGMEVSGKGKKQHTHRIHGGKRGYRTWWLLGDRFFSQLPFVCSGKAEMADRDGIWGTLGLGGGHAKTHTHAHTGPIQLKCMGFNVGILRMYRHLLTTQGKSTDSELQGTCVPCSSLIKEQLLEE